MELPVKKKFEFKKATCLKRVINEDLSYLNKLVPNVSNADPIITTISPKCNSNIFNTKKDAPAIICDDNKTNDNYQNNLDSCDKLINLNYSNKEFKKNDSFLNLKNNSFLMMTPNMTPQGQSSKMIAYVPPLSSIGNTITTINSFSNNQTKEKKVPEFHTEANNLSAEDLNDILDFDEYITDDVDMSDFITTPSITSTTLKSKKRKLSLSTGDVFNEPKINITQQNTFICKNHLSQKENEIDDVTMNKSYEDFELMLSTSEQICEVISEISMGELLSLKSIDSRKLQDLLCKRHSLKSSSNISNLLTHFNEIKTNLRSSNKTMQSESSLIGKTISNDVTKRLIESSFNKIGTSDCTPFNETNFNTPNLKAAFETPKMNIIRPESHSNKPHLQNNNNSFKSDYFEPRQMPESSSAISKLVNKFQASHSAINESTTPITDDSLQNHSPIKFPKFRDRKMDDGQCSVFNSTDHPHYPKLMSVFQQVFGLKTFRKNQLQAINAALLNHDCFVLMPTGGGKSLCYQLPALVDDGVTIVISPLKSLIQDQVQKLLSLDVSATHLSGDITPAAADKIYTRLHFRDPDLKLLYVTPEKISASNKLVSAMENLFRRKLLSRFVIDEAHCVSQWGHDFRPDYKKLFVLKEKFPGVPMIALTATATPRVRQDILHQLRMKNPKWFMQSFNRPNLKYDLRPKKPKALTAEIIDLIHKKFSGQSGIVYCLSRRECDSVAQDLRKARIPAESYHAGLTDAERNDIQRRWISEINCKVVCATIAFGMGIDKPDVRFVIHYSLPKSIEGYYQESGRAGRDGLLAVCTLFYSYQDVSRLRRMIESDEAGNFEGKKVHLDNLYRMVQYCENKTDCRRTQQMAYFGETFDKNKCGEFKGALCDNCSSKEKFQIWDASEAAIEIVKGLKEMRMKNSYNKYTMLHLIEVFKGSKNSKVIESGHNTSRFYDKSTKYGLDRNDSERLFRQMVIEGILDEELHITNHDHTVCYIRLGLKSEELFKGVHKIMFQKRGGSKSVVEEQQHEKSDPKSDIIECCYNDLLTFAKETAVAENKINYTHIFNNETIRRIAIQLPLTIEELSGIEGVTLNKAEKYGSKILQITMDYTRQLTSIDNDFKDFIDDDDEDDGSESFDGGASGSAVDSPYFVHEPSSVTNQKKGSQFKKKWGWKKRNFKKAKGKNDNNKSNKNTNKNTKQSNFPASKGWKNAQSKKPGFLGIQSRPFLSNNAQFMG